MRLRPMPSASPRAGVILVFVTCVITLCALLSMALLRMVRISGAGSTALLKQTRARMTALSGMEYAAARLARKSLPDYFPSVEDRGDDWTFRETAGTGIERALNPSYSHGESWSDAGAPGIYDGETPWSDADGDGRFSAESGRLRGGVATGSLRFSLKIVSPEGGIPVNSGALGPDAADLTLPYHMGLEHCLNNLGAILLPATATGRDDVPAGAPGNPEDPIRLSRLGTDLLSRRPDQGYRSLEEAGRALSLAGYSGSEIATVLPYLNVGPYAMLPGYGKPRDYDSAFCIPYVPIALATAPREVLRSLWMYVQADISPTTDFPQTPPAWGNTHTRSGLPGSGKMYSSIRTTTIFPDDNPVYDEAGQLADCCISARAGGDPSWTLLFERFAANAPAIFAHDYQDLPANAEEARAAWVRAKADMAFQVVALDPPMATRIPAVWSSWGVNHDPMMSAPPAVDFPFSPLFQCIHRIPYPTDPDGDGNYTDWDGGPFEIYGLYPGPQIQPQGVTLSPPQVFQVDALAGGSHLSGRLMVGDRLEFASQEAFENLEGGTDLATRGIRVVESAALPFERRRWISDSVQNFGDPPTPAVFTRGYPHVVSLPRSNIGRLPNKRYSNYYGSLALAGRECGPQGAKVYFPFSEKLDGSGSPFHEAFESEPAGLVYKAVDHEASTTPWYASPDVATDFAPHPPWSASGNLIDRFSIEGWVTLASGQARIEIRSADNQDVIRLQCSRVLGSRAASFIMGVQWRNRDGTLCSLNPALVASPSPLPDLGNPVQSGIYHVAISLERDNATEKTTISLYINGGQAERQETFPTSPSPLLNGELQVPPTGPTRLRADHVDELRFYDVALNQIDARNRYMLGRFAGRGLFVSPAYDLGSGGSRLLQTQWTGMTTRPLSDLVGMRVLVRGYSDADGTPGAEVPGSPVQIDQSGVKWDLSALGPIRSFRYEVEFYRPSLAPFPMPPILDSPVFESIWFTFRRPGASYGAWTAWECR